MLPILLATALQAERIVSLAPALTEDLFAIGAGARVVAVDRYSGRLPEARRLPQVGSLLEITPERILALHPDLVVGMPLQAPSLAALARAGIRTEAIPSDTLEQEFAAIRRLGALTGRMPEAEALARRIGADLRRMARESTRQRRLRAFVVLATDPIFTAGHGSFIDTLLQFANVENAAADAATPWTPYSAERVATTRPDVVIVSKEASFAARRPPWSLIPAVRAGRVVHLDDDPIPGPDVARLLAHLIRLLTPFR